MFAPVGLVRARLSGRPESAVASTDPIPREGRMSRPVIRSDGRTESLSFDCPLASARVPPRVLTPPLDALGRRPLILSRPASRSPLGNWVSQS